MTIEQWPEAFAGSRDEFGAIVSRTTIPAVWNTDEKYTEAPQVSALLSELVRRLYPHLVNAKLRCLFAEKLGGRGRAKIARMSLVSGLWKTITGEDFVLIVNWELWKGMPLVKRLAVLDHELSHCGIDDHERYCLLEHDVEEFTAVVARWGAYREDVRRFGEVLRQQQLELIPA
jgi:hypothetical protein